MNQGFAKGMISVQIRNGWPQNVWAVSDQGEVFEAVLENQDTGVYHGYPLAGNDPFGKTVLKEWKLR